jgi:hypothetical protein
MYFLFCDTLFEKLYTGACKDCKLGEDAAAKLKEAMNPFCKGFFKFHNVPIDGRNLADMWEVLGICNIFIFS